MEILENSPASSPTPAYAAALGGAYVGLSAASRRRGNWPLTAQYEQRAIAEYRRATLANPNNPRFYMGLRVERASTLVPCST